MRHTQVQDEHKRTTVCSNCGGSVMDIVEKGVVGCETCYCTFADEIRETVCKFHGDECAAK